MKHKRKAGVKEVKFELAENQHDEQLLAVGVPARPLLTNTDDPTKRQCRRISLAMFIRLCCCAENGEDFPI